MSIPRILLTPGEPAGIGPDITLQLIQQSLKAELVVVCDPELLISRAQQLQLPIQLVPFDLHLPPVSHQPGQLKMIAEKLKVPCKAGELNTENARYVIRCLEIATEHCLQQQANALVTGPVHKGIINDAGIPFTGHTEFLKDHCHVANVLMLFVVDQLKVALTTTHLPLSQVAKSITYEKLLTTIRLLHAELQKRFAVPQPKILVAGLNPHAGEKGHLGREEIEIITPAIEFLQTEKIDVAGPFPADTLFTENRLKNTDAILAMYHDQALPVIKYIGFNHAVNVTLGLPIIRTSVDHGTALDLAGTHQADAGSLAAAVKLAIQLCH